MEALKQLRKSNKISQEEIFKVLAISSWLIFWLLLICFNISVFTAQPPFYLLDIIILLFLEMYTIFHKIFYIQILENKKD